ncbi:hypothetical protein GCM10009557_52250 [Virgisporangium ochraceum]|uniref:Uncharacterized protein n=1 Tax=Virgisporangium ochraceum TaxID=65505 RepID=A0A8J4A927_9ACTN|nr:hypothetical protein Voc01_101480 [Virgisporangium ochraceum]
MSVQAVVRAATNMAEAVFERHGDEGYQRSWRGMPFPHAVAAVLRGEIPPTQYGVDESRRAGLAGLRSPS